jgi:hypothetical protein
MVKSVNKQTIIKEKVTEYTPPLPNNLWNISHKNWENSILMIKKSQHKVKTSYINSLWK